MKSTKLRKLLISSSKKRFNIERKKEPKLFTPKTLLAYCLIGVITCSTYGKGLRDIVIPDPTFEKILSYIDTDDTTRMYGGVTSTMYDTWIDTNERVAQASVNEVEVNIVGSGNGPEPIRYTDETNSISHGDPHFVSSMSEFIEEDYIYPEDIEINDSDITVPSGATEEMMEVALDGTWLDGYGWLYYELEQEYGINAFISMANAFQEAGWQKSYNASYNNNCYGIMTGSGTAKYFDSLESCIRYWYKLIYNNYVGCGRKSLSSINAKYCPPDSTWSSDINRIANRLKSKVISTMS